MYASWFGLQREPFSIAPDPRFLFMSARHREALAHLLYGVGGGGGFVLLTGEIGAGKTTVCRAFLEQIPPHCAVAYIFNPKLTVPELLQSICDEFRVGVPAAAGGAPGVKGAVDALNAFLLREHAAGRSAVLVIDEAQSLAPEVLEQLRLLTNLETAERKLLQIILIGQPELREMLQRSDLEQLAQRVIARYHLGPLTREETQSYIRHRLAVAGAQSRLPFEPAALARIHELAGGVPRRINLLADRALLGAYAHEQPQVDRRTVEQAAREILGTDGPPARPAGRAASIGAGVLLGAALVGAAGWALWPGGPGAELLAAAPPASSVAPGAAATASAPGSKGSTASTASAAAGVEAGASAAEGPGLAAAPTAAAQAEGPAASDDTSALLAVAYASEGLAWRDLALRWNVAIGEGDACTAASQVRLVCYRSAGGGLPLLRQLARPGWVMLHDGAGRQRRALLVGLGEGDATLQVGSQRHRITLAALARIWRGDFATFWRAPPEWREGADVLAQPGLSNWVATRLSAAGTGEAATLRERVLAFQLTHGLPHDGLVGPLTLMRLNRLVGDGEPTLEGEG